MSVYKNNPKAEFYTFDFWYKGKRYKGLTGATSKRKAEVFEAAQKETVIQALARQAVGGAPVVAAQDVPTLAEAGQDWWMFRGRDGGKPEHEQHRATRLASAIELVGPDKRVTDITADDIARAIEARRGKLVRGKPPANATVNRDVIESIRPVLVRAYGKLLGSGVKPRIDWQSMRLKTPKPRVIMFEADALEGFFEALPEHWRDLARVQATYGLRISELFFHPSALMTINGVTSLRINGDDRKGEDAPTLNIQLTAEDAAMLLARKGRAQAAGLDTVWFRQIGRYSNTYKTGDLAPLKLSSAVWAIRVAMRKADMPGGKGSHDLRHHFAMTLQAETGDIRLVQKAMGHKDIRSTMVYADALPEAVTDAVAKLAARQRAVRSRREQKSPQSPPAARKTG